MNFSKVATTALGLSGKLAGNVGGGSGEGGAVAPQGFEGGAQAGAAHMPFRIGTVVHPGAGGVGAQPGAQSENSDLSKVVEDLLHDRMMGKMGGGDAASGAGQADSSGGAQGMLQQIMKQNQEMEALIASMLASQQQTDGADASDAAPDASQAQAPDAPQMPQAQAPQAQAQAPQAQAQAAPPGAQAPAAAPAAPAAPAAQPQEDSATVLAGNATTLANSDTKCPPGVTMDQLMKANGGVLGSLGNQTLKGDGAKGIEGGIKDNLAKKSGGTDASQIGRVGPDGKASQADLDVTYRALQNVSAFKNTPGADGKPIPDDIRHNGNVSGLQPSKEVARGSTLGEMQDWFKGAIAGPQKQLPKGDKVNDQGVETSGAQQVGKKILDGLSKVAGFFRDAINATIGKIPGIGKILSAPMNLVAGSISDGLKAAGDAAGGHMADAKQDGKDMGHNALATVSEAADQAGDLVKKTLGKLGPLGKLIAGAAKIGTNLITGAANVGDTALKGGDVKGAAENMGKNAAGAVVGAVAGAFDPTSKGADALEKGVDSALGATSQVVAR